MICYEEIQYKTSSVLHRNSKFKAIKHTKSSLSFATLSPLAITFFSVLPPLNDPASWIIKPCKAPGAYLHIEAWHPFLPEASSSLLVVSLPVFVCLCVTKDFGYLEVSTTFNIYVSKIPNNLYFFCMHKRTRFVLSDLSLLRMLSLSKGFVGIEWLQTGYKSWDILVGVIGVPLQLYFCPNGCLLGALY